MKVALVHDWLTGLRGGERCLQAFLSLYPDADIFTMIHVPGSTSPQIDKRVKQVSFMNYLPGVRYYYRLLLPFYPLAIRQLNLEGYDLVISLSHAAAKNVHISEPTRHICYCFTPMRYIWDQAWTYFGALTGVLWPLIKVLRLWDQKRSVGVSRFVGISNFIRARIRCFYHKGADVVYPPVDTAWLNPSIGQQARSLRTPAAFLYAGALVPYKRVDLIVEAFNKLGLPLWIAGSGPEEAKLKRMAASNIQFFGHVSDAELAEFYRSCRALLFPVKEDFGLVPVECMAAGRPVIALYEGACKETILGLKPWDKKANKDLAEGSATGVFIKRTRKSGRLAALVESIEYFLQHESEFSKEACLKQAQRFSLKRFYADWDALMQKEMAMKTPSALSNNQPGNKATSEPGLSTPGSLDSQRKGYLTNA